MVLTGLPAWIALGRSLISPPSVGGLLLGVDGSDSCPISRLLRAARMPGMRRAGGVDHLPSRGPGDRSQGTVQDLGPHRNGSSRPLIPVGAQQCHVWIGKTILAVMQVEPTDHTFG